MLHPIDQFGMRVAQLSVISPLKALVVVAYCFFLWARQSPAEEVLPCNCGRGLLMSRRRDALNIRCASLIADGNLLVLLCNPKLEKVKLIPVFDDDIGYSFRFSRVGDVVELLIWWNLKGQSQPTLSPG
jgi:hypothetical protein